MEVEGEEGEDHEKLRVELNNVIQAQQTALEILANACCGDEDGEQEWVEEDEEEMGQVRRSFCWYSLLIEVLKFHSSFSATRATTV